MQKKEENDEEETFQKVYNIIKRELIIQEVKLKLNKNYNNLFKRNNDTAKKVRNYVQYSWIKSIYVCLINKFISDLLKVIIN